MRPDLVAHKLIGVEDGWREQATGFASCIAEADSEGTKDNCEAPRSAFRTSCSKVASAMVSSSSGDRADVSDYMKDVCGQAELQGWHRERCDEFSAALTGALTVDSYTNRGSFDATKLCTGLWQQIVTVEISEVKAREHREAQTRANEAKRKADEAEAEYATMKKAHLDAQAEVARHTLSSAAALPNAAAAAADAAPDAAPDAPEFATAAPAPTTSNSSTPSANHILVVATEPAANSSTPSASGSLPLAVSTPSVPTSQSNASSGNSSATSK